MYILGCVFVDGTCLIEEFSRSPCSTSLVDKVGVIKIDVYRE